MSITTADFKTGMTILYNNQIFTIVDFQHVKPGKGQAFVRTKLRNLRTGTTTEYSFNAGEKLEQAMIEKEKCNIYMVVLNIVLWIWKHMNK